MSSMLAYLDGSGLELTPGAVAPIDHYRTEDNGFSPLVDGGALYLVTEVDGTPWLVAVLEAPERSQIRRGDQRPHGWYALPNAVPIVEITHLRRVLTLGRRGRLAATLAEPIRIAPAAEQRLRALFDAVDEPVVGAAAKSPQRTVDSTLSPLERASLLLASGEIAGGIAALLDAWRAARHSAIADLIDRATRLLPRFDHPLADGRKAWFAAWKHEREDRMPQLMRNLFDDRGSFARRLELLASVPDDPRIARQLARRIRKGAYHDEALLCCAIVERSRDARAWREIASTLGEIDPNEFVGLRERLAFTAEAPPQPVVELAHVRAIEATLDRLDGESAEVALVDAIAEHPDDEQPCLVYSDWLLERGHPRGEYIALVCQKRRGVLSPASARRLAALEEVPYLYGPLDELATSTRRARAHGIDRSLDLYTTATPMTWLDAARYPLTRALTKLRFIGLERRNRAPGIAGFIAAAPRLVEIEEVSTAFAKPLLKVLGPAWERRGESLVRATPNVPPPRPSLARGTSVRS